MESSSKTLSSLGELWTHPPEEEEEEGARTTAAETPTSTPSISITDGATPIPNAARPLTSSSSSSFHHHHHSRPRGDQDSSTPPPPQNLPRSFSSPHSSSRNQAGLSESPAPGSHGSGSNSSSRKRPRPLLMALHPSIPLTTTQQQQQQHQQFYQHPFYQHAATRPAQLSKKDRQHWQHDQPDLEHFQQLLAALLLTSALAALSALDAKQHCWQHETYALLDLIDDDNFQKAYDRAVLQDGVDSKCVHMFRKVVLPTAAGTALCGLTALWLLSGHLSTTTRGTSPSAYPLSPQHPAAAASETHPHPPPSEQDDDDDDDYFLFSKSASLSLSSTPWWWRSRSWSPPSAIMPAPARPPNHRSRPLMVSEALAALKDTLHITLAVWLLLVIILALQTYHVAAIMLVPRTLVDDTSNNNNNNKNPYQSLAAVDQYGHVGDNANLYYLSWLSQALALALVYQVTTAAIRVRRMLRTTSLQPGLLPATSWENDPTLYESRQAWYSSLYRLRIRTGIWVAALVSSIVLVASSQYIWNQVLWPHVRTANQQMAASEPAGGDDSVGQYHNQTTVAEQYFGRLHLFLEKDLQSHFAVCQVVYNQSGIPPAFCRRTLGASLSGLLAVWLCAAAILMHTVGRYGLTTPPDDPHVWSRGWVHAGILEKVLVLKRLPLRTELALSLLLSVLLGGNAVMSTGVQGPAVKVGNLYYASWLSFLLSVRICLGCLEEYYHLEADETPPSAPALSPRPQRYEAPTLPAGPEPDAPVRRPPRVSSAVVDQPPHKKGSSSDIFEESRVKRVRSYFFLWIFSAICAAAAYDSATNLKKRLTRGQRFMILAPALVAAQAMIFFLLCLSRQFYAMTTHFCVGGMVSVLSFMVWLANLFQTMHSNDSWAVNSIGEIEMANLYYFSWAAIITAGLQMTAYVKGYLGIKLQDNMAVVWFGIVKVCFVMLAAGLHIWHTIRGNCEFDEITTGAVTFCSRTILSLVVALTGLAVACIVMAVRFLATVFPRCQCRRVLLHAEMLLSLFLVLLFGCAVAMITGIGGPGQSVGDLYYSSWLAFCVSLGVFLSCYVELNNEERDMEAEGPLPEGYRDEHERMANAVLV